MVEWRINPHSLVLMEAVEHQKCLRWYSTILFLGVGIYNNTHSSQICWFFVFIYTKALYWWTDHWLIDGTCQLLFPNEVITGAIQLHLESEDDIMEDSRAGLLIIHQILHQTAVLQSCALINLNYQSKSKIYAWMKKWWCFRTCHRSLA